MKIQYASDLHLEFPRNEKFILNKGIIPSADVLILAGDVLVFDRWWEKHLFFDWASDNFAQTYIIPGNHEYYHGYPLKPETVINHQIRSNVQLLDQQTIAYKGLNLIFATLWTNIPPKYQGIVESYVNDFSRIKYKGRIISSLEYNRAHVLALNFLNKELEIHKNERNIVVTHHVPTARLIHPEFANSQINSVFTVDLSEKIKEWNVEYWIYGHNHRNVPAITVDGTTLVTNQLGYVHMGEEKSFKAEAVIEL